MITKLLFPILAVLLFIFCIYMIIPQPKNTTVVIFNQSKEDITDIRLEFGNDAIKIAEVPAGKKVLYPIWLDHDALLHFECVMSGSAITHEINVFATPKSRKNLLYAIQENGTVLFGAL